MKKSPGTMIQEVSHYAEPDSSVDTMSEKTSSSSPSNNEETITIQSYNNRTHKNLFIVLVLSGFLLAVMSLLCGIPGWVLIQMYPRTVVGPNEQVMKNHQFLPLFATGVVLVGIEIALIAVLAAFSAYAMHHEKMEDIGLKTRFGRLNSERMTLAFMCSICGVLFMFLAFYIAFVAQASKMSEKWYFLTHVLCPIDQAACTRVDAGMKLMQSCSMLAMLSIVPLLMILTATISHSGSHKTKQIPINAPKSSSA